jgi:glucose/arabinose dehydrogenase
MQRFLAVFACVGLLAGVVVAQQKQYPYPMVRDQRGAVPAGPRVGPWNSPPLGDGPFLFDSYEQRGLRAVVMAKGLSHPWSIAFLPDDVILITERQGRLRVVRHGKLEPEPVAGIPVVTSLGTMAGLMDIALHPNFVQNKWIYISPQADGHGENRGRHDRDAPVASNSILRGTWTEGLTDIRDIFVADDVDMEASRIAFGPDGMLYMGIGGPGPDRRSAWIARKGRTISPARFFA